MHISIYAWLTITMRGEPYMEMEATRPTLPTKDFRWRWSSNTTAEIAVVKPNTTITGTSVTPTLIYFKVKYIWISVTNFYFSQ